MTVAIGPKNGAAECVPALEDESSIKFGPHGKATNQKDAQLKCSIIVY